VDALCADLGVREARGSSERGRRRDRAAAAAGGQVLRRWAALRGGKRRGGSYLESPSERLTQGWEPGSLAAGQACGAAVLASRPWPWAKGGGGEEIGDPTCKRRIEREGWMCKEKRDPEGFSANSCS
jgi:hypothetical protein